MKKSVKSTEEYNKNVTPTLNPFSTYIKFMAYKLKISQF